MDNSSERMRFLSDQINRLREQLWVLEGRLRTVIEIQDNPTLLSPEACEALKICELQYFAQCQIKPELMPALTANEKIQVEKAIMQAGDLMQSVNVENLLNQPIFNDIFLFNLATNRKIFTNGLWDSFVIEDCCVLRSRITYQIQIAQKQLEKSQAELDLLEKREVVLGRIRGLEQERVGEVDVYGRLPSNIPALTALKEQRLKYLMQCIEKKELDLSKDDPRQKFFKYLCDATVDKKELLGISGWLTQVASERAAPGDPGSANVLRFSLLRLWSIDYQAHLQDLKEIEEYFLLSDIERKITLIRYQDAKEKPKNYNKIQRELQASLERKFPYSLKNELSHLEQQLNELDRQLATIASSVSNEGKSYQKPVKVKASGSAVTIFGGINSGGSNEEKYNKLLLGYTML